MIMKRIISREKKHIKRHLRISFIMGGLLFCLGFFVGVHRNVIKAYIKGEELPKAPKGARQSLNNCCHDELPLKLASPLPPHKAYSLQSHR